MTNSTSQVLDPGVDSVDPVAVLGMLADGLATTEASIIRLQAVKEAHLAVGQRLASQIAAADSETVPRSVPEAVRRMSGDIAERSVAAELAGVLHMSDRVVQGRMARAADLMARFPAAMQAFTEARIGWAHVRQIQDAGARLDDAAVRAAFERAAVTASEGETPHRAKRVVERIAEHLAPRSLTERHQDAQKGRRVWREDLGDGQKALGVDSLCGRDRRDLRPPHSGSTDDPRRERASDEGRGRGSRPGSRRPRERGRRPLPRSAARGSVRRHSAHRGAVRA